MQWTKTISMVEAHAEGEVGRVITAGIGDVPGATMMDKMDYLNTVNDSLRRFCVFEPRGSAQMSTNLLLPPTRPEADTGLIILQGDKAHAMSGSNCICVVTVLLETGMVEMKEPETIVRLDTPAGMIEATASCHNGKCENVSLNMVASFLQEQDVKIGIEGIGRISVDIVFGGIYYALIDPRQLGLTIEPAQARALVDAGSRIHRAINKEISVQHPEMPSLNSVSYTMFIDHSEEGEMIGATVMPPGRLDRSPCGTGNSARLALRHARGETTPGEVSRARSIIGSAFDIKLLGETTVGGYPAVLPRVTGRGWIHGIHQIGLDPSDPYPQGYLLSDCWGDAFDLLQ